MLYTQIQTCDTKLSLCDSAGDGVMHVNVKSVDIVDMWIADG